MCEQTIMLCGTEIRLECTKQGPFSLYNTFNLFNTFSTFNTFQTLDPELQMLERARWANQSLVTAPPDK